MAFTSNYDKLLKSIQDTTVMLESKVDEEEPTINIDWNTRAVEFPPEYKSFLGVQYDHQADTVHFCADRYFDSVDLTTMTCVIEYTNAEKENRICPILDIDTLSDPTKIKFGWKLGRGATKKDGTIKFVVRFYTIDPINDVYVYNLSTQPCQTTIAKGLKTDNIDLEGEDLSVDMAEDILARLKQVEDKAVRWHDLIQA